MFGNLTVGKRLVAGFGLSAFTLAVIAVISYFNVNRQFESDGWVKHTYEVRGKFTDLVEGLIDAETGVRGYIISGDEDFLEPYTSALVSVPAVLKDLRKLTADNPHQQQRLALLSPIIDTKIAQFKERVDLRHTQGLEAAAKLVTTGVSKHTMDQIRTLIRDADQEEGNLLSRRSEEAKSFSSQTTHDHHMGRAARNPRGGRHRLVHIALPVRADRHGGRTSAQLVNGAASGRQSAGLRCERAGFGDDGDQHHNQRASCDLPADRRKCPARGS